MEMKLNNYFRLRRTLDKAIKDSEYCKANPDKRRIIPIDREVFFKNLRKSWEKETFPKIRFTGTKRERKIKREQYKLSHPHEKIITYYKFIYDE